MAVEKDKAEGCFLAVLIIWLLPFFSVVSAWMYSLLWAWFAVPFGVRPISIPHWIGICVFIQFMTQAVRTKDQRDMSMKDSIIESLSVLAGRLLMMAVAYGAHLWMGRDGGL